jgi:hypothetical protein
MKYHRAWSSVCLLVTATGVGAALLQWQLSTVAIAVGATTLLSLLVVSSVVAGQTDQTPLSVLSWRLFGIAFEIALSLVALVAVGSLVPPAAFGLALVAAATSPWVVQWLGRKRHRRRRGSAAPSAAPDRGAPSATERPVDADAAEVPVELPSKVQQLSLSELCDAWRRSFLALKAVVTVEDRLHVVACRTLYLDEMERRNPRGLQEWLAAGARAAGVPDRYLRRDLDGGNSEAA